MNRVKGKRGAFLLDSIVAMSLLGTIFILSVSFSYFYARTQRKINDEFVLYQVASSEAARIETSYSWDELYDGTVGQKRGVELSYTLEDTQYGTRIVTLEAQKGTAQTILEIERRNIE